MSEKMKHYKFRIPITGAMNLYVHGTNAYDALERLKNEESGVAWSIIHSVEKHLDQAEILSESDDGPHWQFNDIKDFSIRITEEVKRKPATHYDDGMSD